MKTSKTLIALTVAVTGLVFAGSALAQHRHHNHGPRLSIGFGFGYPAYPYYYPPYAYYPPYYSAPVVIQRQPVYIEQNPSAPAAQAPASPAPASAYWYYCADTRAYDPYVMECGSGWQRVAPQPG